MNKLGMTTACTGCTCQIKQESNHSSPQIDDECEVISKRNSERCQPDACIQHPGITCRRSVKGGCISSGMRTHAAQKVCGDCRCRIKQRAGRTKPMVSLAPMHFSPESTKTSSEEGKSSSSDDSPVVVSERRFKKRIKSMPNR